VDSLPILYSFRRCPYAIRARMAIHYSQIQVELREVLLADKPKVMLDASAKGTVPVLVLPDGTVLDESLDIMFWSLNQNDPGGWLINKDEQMAVLLLEKNDGPFKQHLDHYKYADRFPEHSMQAYRERGEDFLIFLESQLDRHKYLLGDRLNYIDIAIFPFVRQFAFVDKDWFDQSPYQALQGWLAEMLRSNLFTSVMTKYPRWQANTQIQIF